MPTPPDRPFEVQYPRPTRLSDPYGDFTAEELDRLLSTSDGAMGAYEFDCLFQPLTAGTYEEVVHFLPLALAYLGRRTTGAEQRSEESGPKDCTSSVVWFLSKHAGRLREDGLLTPSRQALFDALHSLCSRFEVEHFDPRVCEETGRWVSAVDLVECSEEVTEILDALYGWNTHASWADAFMHELASLDATDEVRSAWLLEIARDKRDELELWTSGFVREVPPIEWLGSEMERLVFDDALLWEHYCRISGTPISTTTPSTYWEDVRATLEWDS